MRDTNVVDIVEVSRIFGNIDLVCDCSKVVSKHLEQTRSEHKEYSPIGAIFLSHVCPLLPPFPFLSLSFLFSRGQERLTEGKGGRVDPGVHKLLQ